MSRNSHDKYKIIKPYLDGLSSLAKLSKQHDVSLRTLQRWFKNYKTQSLSGLQRQERNDKGKHRKISQQLLQYIEGLALQPDKLSIAAIHQKSVECAQSIGEKPVSYHIVYEIIHNLPQDILVLAQEGSKSYENQFELLHIRESSRPNQIWQADHTLLDITLKSPEGKVCRPWLTIIIDDYSRAIAGYSIFLGVPSALQTALALRQAIWNKKEPEWLICGIPEYLYTDHGSDFTSRHLETVCADLKINLIFSNVGKPRGRGKVERFFNTINQKLLCQLNGYISGKASKMPLLTISEFETHLKDFLFHKYHKECHSMTKVAPINRWSEQGFLPNMPQSLEQLDLLLLTVPTPRKIRRDGIYFKNLRYVDAVLAAYVGESVIIRYDPIDMAEIRVFYDNKFLCRAICQELAGEIVSLKDIVHMRNKRKKELKNIISERKSLVDTLLNNNTALPAQKETKPIKAKSRKPKIKLYQNE